MFGALFLKSSHRQVCFWRNLLVVSALLSHICMDCCGISLLYFLCIGIYIISTGFYFLAKVGGVRCTGATLGVYLLPFLVLNCWLSPFYVARRKLMLFFFFNCHKISSFPFTTSVFHIYKCFEFEVDIGHCSQIRLFIFKGGPWIDDCAKDGGPGAVWPWCSFSMILASLTFLFGKLWS